MYFEENSPERNDIVIDSIKHRIAPTATNQLHLHGYSELVIMASGDMTYSTGGKIVHVSDKSVIFNKAGLMHNPYVKQSPIYERYKIRFFEEDILRSAQDRALLSSAVSTSYTKALTDSDFEEIYAIARSIYNVKSSGTKPESERAYAMAALRALLLRIAMCEEREEIKSGGYIADAVDYINKNLHKSLTIGKIADTFFVSRSKLIYDFKAYCNMNINEYITIGRIEKAKDMLGRGYSVVAVSEACGFSSASYFIKVFSSLVGTTPLQYQIKHSSDTK